MWPSNGASQYTKAVIITDVIFEAYLALARLITLFAVVDRSKSGQIESAAGM